jgi:hypothetical protein
MEIYLYTPNLEIFLSDGVVFLNYVYGQVLQIITSVKL